MKLVEVLIEYATLSLDRPFSYVYSGDKNLEVGYRVLVPFHNRDIIGYVEKITETNKSKEELQKESGLILEEIKDVLDTSPLLNDSLLELAKQLSDYYLCPKIKVLQTMLPPSLSVKRSTLKAPKIAYDIYVKAIDTDEDGLTDFNISVEMNLTGSDSVFSESKEAGIILRCNNYVSFEHFVDKHDDLTMWNNRYYQLQGYYLAFTSKKISLYKMGGDYNFFETISTEKYSFGSKKKKTVVVKVRGNEIDVFIDNQFVMSYFDSNAYVSGSAGLYTTGAEVAYKNLKVSIA